MSSATAPALAAQIGQMAQAAGLTITGQDTAQDFNGNPTTRFWLALPADPMKPFPLELSAGFDADQPGFITGLRDYLAEWAIRLRNPQPGAYLTLLGLPLSFSGFAWPFHGSSSGADTFIVHGQVTLEPADAEKPLHAKVSASMTRTFAEVVPALEQPFAESFIYNAVRKTMDQGQLELVKSGNRQPVPVTTRYYSSKQRRFIFNDTDEAQRVAYLAAKAYWLSGVLGHGAPVWLTDPRDAQYLNTTVEELKRIAQTLVSTQQIELADDGFARPTAELMAHRDRFEAEVADALQFIKPAFNEEMRAGHTNM